MFNLCNKKFSTCKILNVVQRIFCTVKKHADHASKKIADHANKTHKVIVHHVYKHKHRWLSYIHVMLFFIIICLYNFITFNKAEDIVVPTEETPIVIENEPQIIPEETPVVSEEVSVVPTEVTTGEATI